MPPCRPAVQLSLNWCEKSHAPAQYMLVSGAYEPALAPLTSQSVVAQVIEDKCSPCTGILQGQVTLQGQANSIVPEDRKMPITSSMADTFISCKRYRGTYDSGNLHFALDNRWHF